MEAIENSKPKADFPKMRSSVLDRLEKLPDISLKELYFVLKASRMGVKQRLSIESIGDK